MTLAGTQNQMTSKKTSQEPESLSLVFFFCCVVPKLLWLNVIFLGLNKDFWPFNFFVKDCAEVMMGFSQVFLSQTWFYRVLQDFTGFYRVLLDFTGFSRFY